MSQLTLDEKKAAVLREKWEKIALDTRTTDQAKATVHVKEIYKTHGYDEPYIMFVDNPVYGNRIAQYAMKPENKDNLKGVLAWVDTGAYKTEQAPSTTFHGYGQHDAYWLIYWDYLIQHHKDVVSNDEMTKIPAIMNLSEEVFYYWLLDKMAILTVKPEIMAIENNHPHSIFTPALKWKDLELYILDGVLKTKEEWNKETAPFKSSVAQTVFKKL